MLQPIAEQAFVNKDWPTFSSDWLLRPCGKMPDMDSGEFQDLRYKRFYLPLLKASNKDQEWIAYRDYLLALLKIEIS